VKPKDVLIYEGSTRKKWIVKQAEANDAWISKIKIYTNLTIPHIHEYIRLWILIKNISSPCTDDTTINLELHSQ
jgi:hypothetical protein